MFSFNLYAQKDFTLYNFSNIPQSTKINPSIIPDAKVSVGFPVISSFYVNYYNSSFKPFDIIKDRPQDDSLTIDVDFLLSQLKDDNYMDFDLNTELLFIGFKLSKGFLSFGVDHNIDFRFDYAGDFIKFLWYGNESFYNNPANFDNTNVELNHYLSYHIGYSYKLNDKISFGTRLKLLKGFSNINVEKMNLSLNTVSDSESSYALEGDYNFIINTSGMYDHDFYKNGNHLMGVENDFDIGSYLFNKKNNGYAIDLGFTYNINKKFTINASAIDLGFINWESDPINYKSKQSTFYFDGINLNYNNDSIDVFKSTLDTLSNIFEITSTYENYKTNLNSKFYLSGYYNINEKNKVGVLFFGRKYRNNFEKAISLNYYLKASKNFNFLANYTIFENKFDNLGLGLSLNLGPFQSYIISDNILSAFNQLNTDRVNLRFGLNIFIRNKPKKQAEEEELVYN